MIKDENGNRKLTHQNIQADLVIVGGGISGVCASVSAARHGLSVALVQDRPVLGGNASSEVRLWVLGATSHMGNNNRWSREGGIIDEILLDNLNNNKYGNPVLFDVLLLDKIYSEQNIQLFLNTVIYDVEKQSDDKIKSIVGYNSQNSTKYTFTAPYFCDASGDGIVAFLSGAAFRMGAEPKEEFGELAAPNKRIYGELLGHSIYFYTRNIGKPVKYNAPKFAIKKFDEIPKFRNFDLKTHTGCKLWWIEFGGRLDTIKQSEEIKFELWKIIYGLWDYVKNSGNFPDAENYTLEWVGSIPGKRESRRFEGEYMLKQQDIIAQKEFFDAVAHGGWAIDLHPSDGVYSNMSSCNQYHSKGIYSIPFRCFFSKNIDNLFLAGRIISVTHVAFGSTRVMATCGAGGQVVGTAAAIALQNKVMPKNLSDNHLIEDLQNSLLKDGHYIPNKTFSDVKNKIEHVKILATSEFEVVNLKHDAYSKLEFDTAQLIPVKTEKKYEFEFIIKAEQTSILKTNILIAKGQNFTPDTTISSFKFEIKKGEHKVKIPVFISINNKNLFQYVFIVFKKNTSLSIAVSNMALPGIKSVLNKTNPAVSNFGKQEMKDDIGIDSFKFWTPQRRPAFQNLAFHVNPSINCFKKENLTNGVCRPTPNGEINAWIPSFDDTKKMITLKWSNVVQLKEIILFFDTDFDHALESILMVHNDTIMPNCPNKITILNDKDEVIKEVINHQTIKKIHFDNLIETSSLNICLKTKNDQYLPTLYQVLCY